MVLNSKSREVIKSKFSIDMDIGTSSGTGQNNEETKNSKFGAQNGKLKSYWKEVRP